MSTSSALVPTTYASGASLPAIILALALSLACGGADEDQRPTELATVQAPDGALTVPSGRPLSRYSGAPCEFPSFISIVLEGAGSNLSRLVEPSGNFRCILRVLPDDDVHLVDCLFDGPDVFTNNEIVSFSLFDAAGERCADIDIDLVATECNISYSLRGAPISLLRALKATSQGLNLEVTQS